MKQLKLQFYLPFSLVDFFLGGTRSQAYTTAHTFVYNILYLKNIISSNRLEIGV